MKRMNYALLAAAVSFVMFGAKASAQNFYSYDIPNESLPCTQGCTGNIALTNGTISTNNLGTLSANNFVIWTMTITPDGQPPITLTQQNSGFGISGTPQIVATESDLTITLNNATKDAFTFSGAGASWLYALTPGQVITYQQLDGQQDAAAQQVMDPSTFTASVRSVQETPEPASFLLVFAGVLIGLACFGVQAAKRSRATCYSLSFPHRNS